MNPRSLKQRTRAGYGSSPYRGVSWNSHEKKWKAEIRIAGKNKGLGYYRDELEALAAVNKAYAQYFPECPELYQAPKDSVMPEQSILTRRWV